MIIPLTASRDRLLALCSGLTPDQSQQKISSRDWSIAEIIEHLAISERTSILGVKRTLTQPEADVDTILQTTEKSDWIRERIAVRTKKISSPDFLLPNGRYDPWPGPLNAFEQARTNTLKLAVSGDAAFDSRIMPHPILGPLTLRQWFYFTSAHCERHSTQIEEILATTR